MTDRREQFGRAAYEVIATRGLRALTHRAVDEAAELPAGSVNYYAPTRAKLLQLALTQTYERVMSIAQREYAPVIGLDGPAPENELLDCTVTFVRVMSTQGRGVVTSRHALLMEAQFDIELREMVIANRREFVEFASQIVFASPASRSNRAAELVVAMLEGLVQQQALIVPEPFPDSMIRSAVRSVFGFGLAQSG